MIEPAPLSAPSTADLLAEHVGWIRELARHLCADADQAEDVAQDACVVALERPPRDATLLRPWLASVVRNALRESARRRIRRETRERRAARVEALEATDRLVERVSVERELAAFVLELDEPYRSAILLRFFEELAPRDIARRLDVPVNTVHSRIARGLKRLRERLDRAHGERGAWLALLVPLEAARTLPVLTLGGLIVNAKLVLTVVSIAAAGTLAALVALPALRGTEGARPDPRAGEVAAARVEPPRGPGPDVVGGTGEIGADGRAVATSAPATSAAPAAAAPAVERVVRGRVLDAQGNPVGGIEVAVVEDPRATARSGLGGAFELRTVLTHANFRAAPGPFVSVRTGTWRAGSTYEPIVVIAPAIDLAGEVRGASGIPLPGAQVSYALPPGFDTRFVEILESSQAGGWDARADQQGRFAIARAPQVPGATLRALSEGYEPGVLTVPDVSDPGLVFVLERPATPLAGVLRGRVVDPDGRPVAGARVAAGLASTTSDEEGAFAIELARAVTATSVCAVKAGHRSATLSRPDEPDGASTGWPDEVVLRLGGPPLTIAGRVVDSEGAPRAGLRVWIADPTPFGTIGHMPTQIEHLAAGAPVPPQAIESASRMPERDGDNYSNRRMRASSSNAFWYWVTTDDQGRFTIDGLEDREYRLSTLDLAALTRFTSEPIRAGETSARIELPAPKLHPELAGRVVDDSGRPVADVDVILRVDPYRVRSRVFGGTSDVTMIEIRGQTRTDSDGRFSFRDVPVDGPILGVRSEQIVPRDRPIEPGDDPRAVIVEVHARCHLDVRLRPPHDRADQIEVRDAGGEPVDLMRIEGTSTSAMSAVELVDGRSGVVSVSSAARTLVLLRDGQEIETHVLDLRRGEVNVVEP